ncbi:hypothetical protein NDU88_002449 [Pleurodeles waltl]|uniref:Uncharacterized protein n=1 Tax=Pleurodeles waltl TaxID=8319 RepID=A0AAV7NDS1_PLEWA|nr:hypothetical protein NDU88_002449 [Pleurodeles waltl]
MSPLPDFTAAVQAKRTAFLEVKKVLQDEGAQYSLMFPPKLKIMLDGTMHFCDDPKGAWDWLDAYRSGPARPDFQPLGGGANPRLRKRLRHYEGAIQIADGEGLGCCTTGRQQR